MKRLIEKKLMWGVVVMVVIQIQGILPTADFLPPAALKVVCFIIGITLTAAKGIEMFFEQSAQLESKDENYIKRDVMAGTVETGTRKTVTETPTPEAAPTKPT